MPDHRPHAPQVEGAVDTEEVVAIEAEEEAEVVEAVEAVVAAAEEEQDAAKKRAIIFKTHAYSF